MYCSIIVFLLYTDFGSNIKLVVAVVVVIVVVLALVILADKY